MDKMESLEAFYKRKFDFMPDELKNEIGHFNVFRLEPYAEGKPTNIPYRRRDFYKIMLVKGSSQVHYADKVIPVKKQALSFSNPMIPYKWEHLDKVREGIYCVFNPQFFHQFGPLAHYEVFQPNGAHIFELTDAEAKIIQEIFARIEMEFNSDYKYKYDAIRTQVLELIHFALKKQPTERLDKPTPNAAQRIATLFLELLERQFPIDDLHPEVKLRTASGFADQLSVHVNHLNRAVKETTDKTTTQLIAERLVQESKILLRHSGWSVSEIGQSLGFSEVTHFNNFFKKHVGQSPLKFRRG
jgi:AraC family transcriptional regulator, transcriptional activator of pobA